MPRIRVLVVDDAVVVRRVVTGALAEDPDIEVVGAAANGRIALAKIEQVNPDVVTMDIEMPEMSGLEALRELRKTHPALPVIMFSTLTERGATATLEALALGASDYVTKPANVGSVAAAQQRIREDLIPKMKALCARKLLLVSRAVGGPAAAGMRPTPTGQPRIQPAARSGLAPQRVDVVAIGVSTGGPNALSTLLSGLPGNLPVPIVIVQHMPPLFTRLLADRLRQSSRLDVREGVNGGALAPGRVWIAPGDHHMTVRLSGGGVRLALNQEPPENSCRPAVDPLFRSVGATYGANALGVILTGMGKDGLRGCEEFVERGAAVIAQDEATSVVWGMPGFVANAGLADRVLPLHEIAGEIARRTLAGRGGNAAVEPVAAGTTAR
ncbi:MAG: chemotaxis response regulator protein-glutamate methylesterase [Gemmatimonadaceae bacterium]|nr:chemotaxis response regulator protein-glutamate methylesterase [Gemmatimonadaceae bacterium]